MFESLGQACDYRFPFGKYRGKTPYYVITHDIVYAEYCMKRGETDPKYATAAEALHLIKAYLSGELDAAETAEKERQQREHEQRLHEQWWAGLVARAIPCRPVRGSTITGAHHHTMN